MNRKTLCHWLALTIAVLVLSAPTFGELTVIFTRHAEKGATPPQDPPLTEAGKQRAEALASMLADSGVEAIYTSEVQRTQQTAAPLATRVHVTPTVIPAKDTAALVNAIRSRRTGVVVVVGHSNTLPEIISALGGPKVEISDSQYDNLFVLTVGASQSSLLRMHYGDSSPVNAGSTHDMTMPPKN
jgi:broad specificity phosphatase PhoE